MPYAPRPHPWGEPAALHDARGQTTATSCFWVFSQLTVCRPPPHIQYGLTRLLNNYIFHTVAACVCSRPTPPPSTSAPLHPHSMLLQCSVGGLVPFSATSALYLLTGRLWFGVDLVRPAINSHRFAPMLSRN